LERKAIDKGLISGDQDFPFAKEKFIKTLPYYIFYSELEIGNLLNRVGILNQDDRIIFTQICQTVSISNSPTIDVDDFLIDVIKWAERHNYSALRSGNTTKKLIQNFCLTLTKHHLCITRSEDGEIAAFTMTEPQFEQVAHSYKEMETNPELAFPDDHALSLPMQPSNVVEVLYGKINTQFIEDNIDNEKMIKIVFPELNSHILVTPRLMVQLPTACIRKLGKFFSATSRIRILDSILKSMEIILPEKDLKLDRILKVLNLEDKESPIFFVHLTDNILSRLKKDAKVTENIPILQATLILKQFKLEQEEKEKYEKKDELANEDIKRILYVLKENPKGWYIQELYHLREEESRHGKFAGTYDKNEFAHLVDKFIDTYTINNENAEQIEDSVPEIIKLTDNESREMYIYRGYIVSLLERERVHARQEIRLTLLERWIKVLENYMELPEMKRDDILEKEVVKIIDQKYKLLKYVVIEPVLLFKIFKIYENDKEIKSKMAYYFANKDKSMVSPYFAILEIKRAELYHEAFLALPFTYRFFLTRFILYIVQLFKKGKQDGQTKNSDSETSGGEKTAASDADQQPDASELKKAVQSKVRKFLPEIEKNYRSGGGVQEALDELYGKWNIKVGEVSEILKEKIDNDIMERSTSIYKMLVKSPNFTPEYLHRELKNMAVDLAQNKYTEIQDKKSLARYIMLYSISILRQRNR
jgi:hypothetical protein